MSQRGFLAPGIDPAGETERAQQSLWILCISINSSQPRIARRRNGINRQARLPKLNSSRVEDSGTAESLAPTELEGFGGSGPLLKLSALGGPKLKEPGSLELNKPLGCNEPATANALDRESGLPLKSVAAIVTLAGLPALPPMIRAF